LPEETPSQKIDTQNFTISDKEIDMIIRDALKEEPLEKTENKDIIVNRGDKK